MRKLALAVVLLAACALAGPAASLAASCHARIPRARITHRAPPHALLARMAVLRRPQQRGDKPHVDFGLFPYRLLAIDYMRKLGEGSNGESYYLVPGSTRFPLPPRRCLRHLSRHQRRVQEHIRREERKRGRVIGLGLFLFSDDGSGAGSCCSDAHALVSNHTLLTTGRARRSTVIGLVPDGVASVTLRWHRGPERDATVANNFWVTHVPRSAPRAFPTTTIWRDADGHLVKSFRERGGF